MPNAKTKHKSQGEERTKDMRKETFDRGEY